MPICAATREIECPFDIHQMADGAARNMPRFGAFDKSEPFQ